MKSGKLSLRLTPRLHTDLAEEAKTQGVSINLLINEFLARQLEASKKQRKERKES